MIVFGVFFMIDAEFRMVFLPYCLQRDAGGGYTVLNRKYMPVGIAKETGELVAPSIKFKRSLTAKQVAQLSWDGSEDAECIYLYADGCVPTRNLENWSAYSQRLALLSGLAIQI